MTNIHPLAYVEDGAQVGKNVIIEPFAVVKKGVSLGDNVVVKSHAYLDGYTTIGDGTTIYPSASIGTKTQAKLYNGEKTYVKIGKNCEIREFVTINSSYEEGSTVEIGDNCLIMAYCHIAHHCKLGKNVIMANSAMLAGHVTVEDNVNIGGMTPIHQHVKIGAHSMVGGLSRITQDIPPFTIGAGIPYKLAGLNIIGLKRSNISIEVRSALTKAFKITYRSGLYLKDALRKIDNELEKNSYIQHWIRFCSTSKRGLIDHFPDPALSKTRPTSVC